MSKLYFRYGAMNCGKTTALMQVAYNYLERDMKAVIIKPSVDKKGDCNIVSRLGITKEVDYLIDEKDNIPKIKNVDCILVDEAQFLTREQVNQLYLIAKLDKIPVICYGLRSDFKTNGFEGSIRLFEIADTIEEMKTICRCGKKATLNVRKINDKIVFDGDQVAIDTIGDVTYESMCGECYLKVKKEL